ncbi:BrnT family toxin [Sphingobium sp. DC-2]|uniref:BrnT family toxin n=1 Tax=Sphingobium sp. DC-2 TaxID=1303256 RepID=UPI0004C39A01|nr:BrnT family toxin [Sphingobium sp. DC-2]
MEIEFDPAKDAANIEKHGISLERAADLELLAYVDDSRFEEPRFRLYGLIDGLAHCVAGTDRGGKVRVISLRRAHAKEMKRYV